MSEQASEKILSGINIPKILAGALAAVCAAVVGSFLGVAGTLIGAAVASVVGSVGTEIYERSLKRGAQKLQTLAPTFIRAPAAVGTPEVAAATPADDPSHTVPEEARKKQIRWGRIAAAAGTVFVLSMAGIWVAEKALGEPIAAAVGASNSTGTTLGGTSKTSTPAPVQSAAPSEQPSGSSSGAPASPSPSAAPTTGTPTTDPTAVTPTTTGEAVQSADPGAGGGAVDSGDTGTGSGTDAGTATGFGPGADTGTSSQGSK